MKMIFVECFHHIKYTRFIISSECQTIVGKPKFTIIFPEHGRNDEGVAYSTLAAEFHKTRNR